MKINVMSGREEKMRPAVKEKEIIFTCDDSKILF